MLGTLVAEKLDTKSFQLSGRQLATLKTRLPEVLSYLWDPTFEKYHRLKADGFRSEIELSPKSKLFLQQNGLVLVT